MLSVVRVVRPLLLALAPAALAWILLDVPAWAATIPVTTTADEGGTNPSACSLREAITAANTDSAFGGCPAGAGADTINLPAGTYTLTRFGFDDTNAAGDLDIASDLTINGVGAATTIVDGNRSMLDERAFHVLTGVHATLAGLTIRNGAGGILNTGATLTVANSTLTGNVGTDGAIFNGTGAVLTVTGSTLSGNSGADGGAIYSVSNLTVTNSTLSGNSALAGGGIYSFGTVTLTNSTLSGNSALYTSGAGFPGVGGGIYSNGGTITITNSTLSGNSADVAGGFIYNDGGTLTMTNSTLSGNVDPGLAGGILNNGRMVTLRATVLDTGLTGANCSDQSQTLTSQGSNLSDDTSCQAILTQPGDKNNVDLKLGPLANNGGPTQTHALMPGSPAIDAVVGSCAVAADQRAVSRPQDGDANGSAICDSGAFERAPGVLQFSTPTYSVSEAAGDATITVIRTNGSDGEAGVTATPSDGTAVAPADYANAPRTVSFAAGQTSATVQVPIVDDTLDEADETVNLTLGHATGGASIGAPSTAVLTIQDNDVGPVAACAPRPRVTVAVARTGDGHLQVTVSATSNAGFTNSLQAITWGQFRNATVQANNVGPVASGQRTDLQPGTTAVVFLISRVTSGQAATVSLTVTDACGDWSTFAGGGPTAF